MNEPLRPMSTGELLDRTFRLYRGHFLLFVGLGMPAPTAVLVFFLLTVIVAPFSETAATISILLLVIAGSAVLLYGFAFTKAATIRAVSDIYLSRPTSIRHCYERLRDHRWRIIDVFLTSTIRMVGVSALACLVVLLFSGMIIVAVIAATSVSDVGVTIALVVLVASYACGLLLALMMFAPSSLAVQACVIEDIPAKAAIKRSTFLADGSRNRIVTIYLLFWALSLVVITVLIYLAVTAGNLFRSEQADAILVSLAFFLTPVLTMPVVTVAMSLAYYDARVRKEAFDLELLLASLESPAAKAAAAP